MKKKEKLKKTKTKIGKSIGLPIISSTVSTLIPIETIIKEYRRPLNRRLTTTEQNLCIALRIQGYTIYEVAQKLNCDPTTVYNWCKKAGYGTPRSKRRYKHVSPADFVLMTTGRNNVIKFTTITGKTYNILKF